VVKIRQASALLSRLVHFPTIDIALSHLANDRKLPAWPEMEEVVKSIFPPSATFLSVVQELMLLSRVEHSVHVYSATSKVSFADTKVDVLIKEVFQLRSPT
jgi:hypothetical protein